MRYMGGKSRIANCISDVINRSLANGEPFVSLFCGACSVESKVNATSKVLNDKHEYLIEMLRAVQNGYELPDSITEEQYRYIKRHCDDDKALSGFVGFACSFGSVEFWKYIRALSEKHLVFISEQTAPDDFIPIWEKRYRRNMVNNINDGFLTAEKLFVHSSNLCSVRL